MHFANRFGLVFPLFALMVAVGGCDKKDGGGGEGAAVSGSSGHPVWGDYDLSKKLDILQGKKIMKLHAPALIKSEGMRKMQEDMIFEVKGAEVTVTAEKGEVVKGQLKVTSPCGVEFLENGQPKAQFNFVDNGKDAWFGLGGAGTKLGNGYIICDGFGFVTWDGQKCTHYKSRPGQGDVFETQAVKCSLAGDQFKYQLPKFMREGEFEDKALKVVDGVLLSEQMETDHKVRPAP